MPLTALLNLCGTSYSLTDPSAAGVTFTTYQGWSGFSTNNAIILDTNFNATTATSPNFTQNSTAFGAWVYAVINEASNPIMGTDQGGLSGKKQSIYEIKPMPWSVEIILVVARLLRLRHPALRGCLRANGPHQPIQRYTGVECHKVILPT